MVVSVGASFRIRVSVPDVLLASILVIRVVGAVINYEVEGIDVGAR